jgi:very-short-patch-repair endonuclease
VVAGYSTHRRGMSRRPAAIPAELTCGPITVAEARRAGLDHWHLRGKSWRRVGPALYVPSATLDSPRLMLAAALPRMPANSVFSGYTAAWLHGLDVPPCDPIEVTVPRASGVTTRTGLAISRARLDDSDVVVRAGLLATSILRTLIDLGQHRDLVEAVVITDMALHQRLTTLAEFQAAIEGCGHRRNVKRLRRVVALAEPRAESPMETRLRLVLMNGGLPRPEAQVNLYDRNGDFIARTDLYYPSHRLAIEYDGGNHRDRLADDDRRQNAILSAGYGLLRFTAGDVQKTPELTVAQARSALAARHP